MTSLLGVGAPHAVAAAIHGSTFEVITQSGHDLTLEQPEKTAQRAAQFFRSVKRSNRAVS